MMKKDINTIGDLKEVLNNFDDEVLINFGTERYGFSINSYDADCISLALKSDDLEEYLIELKSTK